MEKVITFGLKITTMWWKNGITTHRTVWVDFDDHDEENLHHSTLPSSTKLFLFSFSTPQPNTIPLAVARWHPVRLALRLYPNTGAAAVRPWPTKTVLKLAQSVSSEKTTLLLLVSRIQLLTTRVVTIGKVLWAERECNPVVSVYNDMGLETHINSICQLAFTVDFRRWANVLQVPLSCA